MTTGKQDRDFIAEVINDTLLETAIDWIKRNMEPGDVFDTLQLSSWAESNGYVESE